MLAAQVGYSLLAGRGGAEHKAIQKRIREAALALGFRCDIEQAAGSGSADVGLVRSDISIACEITVTTTIDHEVGNVLKCIDVGFKLVAVISRTPAKRESIREAVVSALGSQIADRVRGFSPDEFIALLKALPAPAEPSLSQSAAPKVKSIHGYKVKTTFAAPPADEQKALTEQALKNIVEIARKKKR